MRRHSFPAFARRFGGRRFPGRRWTAPLLLLAIVAVVLADRCGWLLVRNVDDLAAYHGRSAKVTRVIDGDTIEIALHDELAGAGANAAAAAEAGDTTRVRLWGIDCPELAHFGNGEQPFAREAKDFAQSMLDGRDVRLFLEAQRPRDSFGRILAHVETLDGRSLNEALLEAGLARADDRWPHTRLTRYAQVEMAAQRRGAGMWAKTAGAAGAAATTR